MDIEAVRAIALALPEVIEAPDFGDGAFRVQGRIFVCVSPDQRPVPSCSTSRSGCWRWRCTARRWRLHWGTLIPGLRVDLSRADPQAVAHLVRAAWRPKASRRLVAATMDQGPAV